jgi:hypothetical protein
MVAELDESNYLVDYHLENVLVFPPKSQLYDHNLVKVNFLKLSSKNDTLNL